MTPEDARKLLGGYATGSLTEAERTALFQAALEDQELFDELAGEQVLKEVLDEPGARQRLIAALEPPRHRAWLWVTAAATVAVAVVIGVVVSSRTAPPSPQQPPQQIAQVMKSPEPVAPPVARESVPAPAPPKRKVAPAPERIPEPAPAPPAELKKEEPPAEQADQLQQAKPQAEAAARGGAARGFVAGAPAAAALRAQNEAVAVSAFAFSYAVRPDGFLQIIPLAAGFLSVTANDAVIFAGGAVSAGTPVRIAIPPDTTNLVIGFSAMPGIAGAPVRRDETSGTVADQDPPNGKILIRLSLTPANR